MSATRWAQLLGALFAIVLLAWGLGRLRPRVVALRAALADAQTLAAEPGAEAAEVAAARREVQLEREAGARSQATPLPVGELSRYAAEAGLAVDVSGPWLAPDPATARRRVSSSSGPPTLPEQVHRRDPERRLIAWEARGDYAGVLRFLDALQATGHAAVLELSRLELPEGGGPLQIELVLAP